MKEIEFEGGGGVENVLFMGIWVQSNPIGFRQRRSSNVLGIETKQTNLSYFEIKGPVVGGSLLDRHFRRKHPILKLFSMAMRMLISFFSYYLLLTLFL